MLLLRAHRLTLFPNVALFCFFCYTCIIFFKEHIVFLIFSFPHFGSRADLFLPCRLSSQRTQQHCRQHENAQSHVRRRAIQYTTQRGTRVACSMDPCTQKRFICAPRGTKIPETGAVYRMTNPRHSNPLVLRSPTTPTLARTFVNDPASPV